jgi:hypothetical protein
MLKSKTRGCGHSSLRKGFAVNDEVLLLVYVVRSNFLATSYMFLLLHQKYPGDIFKRYRATTNHRSCNVLQRERSKPAMAGTCKPKSTATPNLQSTSDNKPIKSRWGELPAKPTELQLDRRQYPRPAYLNPAKLVMAWANHDTDDPISTSTPRTANVESRSFPSTVSPANAPKCNGSPSECHEYYASKYGVNDE